MNEELIILHDLLTLAGDHFGNHNSNDYELDNTPANFELMKKALEWNGDPEDQEPHISDDGKKIYTQDFFLMDYFSDLAKEAYQEGNKP